MSSADTSLTHLPADVQAALAQDMTIDITTTGRKSGQARRIEIWFLHVDGVIYITGTPGPRDWFANLAANPEMQFHLKESLHADLDALATIVTDRDERQRVFDHATAQWYSNQGDSRADLLDEAPMVRLTFV